MIGYEDYIWFFDFLKNQQYQAMSESNLLILENSTEPLDFLYDSLHPLWLPVCFYEWSKKFEYSLNHDFANVGTINTCLQLLYKHGYILLEEKTVEFRLIYDITDKFADETQHATLYYSLSPKGFKVSVSEIENEISSDK